MDDLISRRALLAELQEEMEYESPMLTRVINDAMAAGLKIAIMRTKRSATVDAVALPCKIGDTVWAIRSFHGIKHPQEGIVSEMFFTNDMKLQIVVKYVARGEWGKEVFPTCKDAQEAIDEQERSGASWCE